MILSGADRLSSLVRRDLQEISERATTAIARLAGASVLVVEVEGKSGLATCFGVPSLDGTRPTCRRPDQTTAMAAWAVA